jgi:HNH endonuclease
MKGQDSFGVDHYRPKKKFPDLESTYSNLFYACNCCNRRKSDFWPTAEETHAGRFIPNPCDHVMFEHLRYRSAHVDPRTTAGKQAESKLMLNDKDSVEYREMVLGLMILAEEKIGLLRETIKRIEMKALMEPEKAEELEKEKEVVGEELRNLERYLSKITGGG